MSFQGLFIENWTFELNHSRCMEFISLFIYTALETFHLNSTDRFHLYRSINDAKTDWNQIPNASLLLSTDYLQTLETYRPENMNFRYVVAFKSDVVVACFYFQLIPFNAADRLQLKDVPKDNLFSCFYRHLKKFVAKKVDLVTLICGNLLATGAFGFKHSDKITYNEMQIILDQILKSLFQHLDSIDFASICLIKELPESQGFDDSLKSALKYFHPFYIQPSMILSISKDWTSIESYLTDLQSKYRLRIRKAAHAADDLTHKELSIDEIENLQEKIYNLYLNTADGSDFNLVNLHPEYFFRLKLALGIKYRIFGFFQQDELIAFYSFVDDSPELLGHFLGTMKENNLKYQIYMNILLQFIKQGIEGKYKTINLARTAIEIKSSVGAVPVDMLCYLTHRNKIYNAFVPNLIQYLTPKEKYIIRKPFKKINAGELAR